MTLTKNHPMDTVMTPTNNHPTTRTNHHLTDTILISHHTMNMKNLMRNHTNQSMKSHLNQSMKKSHTNLNTSKSHTMIMKNLLTRIHMNQSRTSQNTNQSRTNQNMSLSHTMNMKNLLTRNHTNINMSPSHTMIMKPLITIPMSLMIITQSLSMSITKNIPIHLPNTSMATNHLGTRNMA